MQNWSLPTALEVAGKPYKIRTDYRVILDILTALNDPCILDGCETDAEKAQAKAETMLDILYEDYETIPPEHLEEACKKATWFIDCGMQEVGKKTHMPKVMDWEQDAPIMIPAINSVYHADVRAVDYMHWWTFFGYYMEIGESLFSTVLSIRNKKAKGKRLEKWEAEFYKSNKHIIDLTSSGRSEDEKEALRQLFGLK